MIPKEFANRLKDKALDKGIEVFLDSALKYGGVRSGTLHCEINKAVMETNLLPILLLHM